MGESVVKPWKEVDSLGDGDKSIVYLSPEDIEALPNSVLSKMGNYEIACLVSDNNTVGDSQISVCLIAARLYVQDGLVGLWDGIENNGWGEHAGSASAWKDLTEHCITPFLSDTSSYQIKANCVTQLKLDTGLFEKDGDSSYTLSTFKKDGTKVSFEGGLTIEACMQNHELSNGGGVVVMLGGFSNGFFVNPDKKNIYYTNNAANAQAGWSFAPREFGYYNTARKEIHTYCGRSAMHGYPALSIDGLEYIGAEATDHSFNGTFHPTAHNDTTPHLQFKHTYAGDSTRNSFYCIRVYNRVLTDDEVKWNYFVDSLRFK